ncbi:hypothetical protein GPECTOR_117g363 [Gonium pectorale]|uniref:Thioredoxin domain-containing protein n=1 Tax=Gonium pectorale TaxID=33097 RepID=A0A150FYY6_GONPE|nr:hypothetical protein GPECTOR_117g363 [Gonium pectorale]|eukprot:KXZ42798.1 hypothetical protein GPECTOR_117g363 [Gonium pectorale]
MGGRIVMVPTPEAWEKELADAKAANMAVIVDFFAQWCGPCKAIAPLYETLSNENPTIVFLKVDVDENGAVAELAGVTAMPTFIVYKDGVKVDELLGASNDKLKALVAKYK